MIKFSKKLDKLSISRSIDLQYINKKTPLWKPLIFLLPALILLILFTIFPLVISFSEAFVINTNENKYASDVVISWRNFNDVVTHPDFIHSLLNSLLIAFLQLPIAITISLIVSSAIASIIRKTIRGGTQTLFFLPYITSSIAIGLAFAYIFDSNIGIINNLLGTKTNFLDSTNPQSFMPLIVIVINGVWSSLAFQILIFTTAMLGINKDRFRAASIDGAGSIKQFFTITIPSIKKTLSFIVTVGIIAAIKVFPLALFENNPSDAMQNGGGTLMLYVYKAIQEGQFRIAAASSIILVTISILFSIFIKNSIKLIGIFFIWIDERKIQRKILKFEVKFKNIKVRKKWLN